MIDPKIIEEEYVEQSQAAVMLNVSRSRINKLCNEGRFEGAIKAGWAWLIPRKSVENFKRLRPGKKRPGTDEKELLLKAIKEADNLKKKGDNND